VSRSFQSKIFIAALSASVLALSVAGLLFSTAMRREMNARIERTLIADTRLAAELLRGDVRGGTAPIDIQTIDAEADRIGELLQVRVTFIALDGTVMGDSSEPVAALPGLENHATRPEVVAARTDPIGIARRYSDTLKIDGRQVLARQPDGIHFTRDGAVAPARLILDAMAEDFPALRRR